MNLQLAESSAASTIGEAVNDFDSTYLYNNELFLEQGRGGRAQWTKLNRDNLREEDWDQTTVYYKVHDDDGGWFGVPTGHTDHTHAKYGLSYGAFLELTHTRDETYGDEVADELIELFQGASVIDSKMAQVLTFNSY